MKNIGLTLSLFAIVACAQVPVKNVTINPIETCSSAPHCVSSLKEEVHHPVPSITFSGSVEQFQQTVKNAVGQIPRSEIVQNEGPYIHATVTSLIFRFTDDVEFYYDQNSSRIDVKSTSRVGYYDFETNKNRVEKLRSLIEDKK